MKPPKQQKTRDVRTLNKAFLRSCVHLVKKRELREQFPFVLSSIVGSYTSSMNVAQVIKQVSFLGIHLSGSIKKLWLTTRD